MEKQCSIIPFYSLFFSTWGVGQKPRSTNTGKVINKLLLYNTIFKEKVCNFYRGVTQSFGIIMSETKTILRKGLRRGSRILLSVLHLLTLSASRLYGNTYYRKKLRWQNWVGHCIYKYNSRDLWLTLNTSLSTIILWPHSYYLSNNHFTHLMVSNNFI